MLTVDCAFRGYEDVDVDCYAVFAFSGYEDGDVDCYICSL